MIIKLLFVAITITLAKANTRKGLICEDTSKTLWCPSNSGILVHSAFYGRRRSDICKGSRSHVTYCGRDVTQKVRGLCNTRQHCTVSSLNSLYGDPCKGVRKYTQVEYSCWRCQSV